MYISRQKELSKVRGLEIKKTDIFHLLAIFSWSILIICLSGWSGHIPCITLQKKKIETKLEKKLKNLQAIRYCFSLKSKFWKFGNLKILTTSNKKEGKRNNCNI